MKKLAIIGAGSAGLQSTCHFIYWLRNDWEITLIHDPSIPSLGIGESTNGGFPSLLVKALQFEISDMNEIDATHKFGTWYKDWRKTNFMGPLVIGSHALHFNTHKLKDFVINRLKNIYGKKFVEILGNVNKIINNQNEVKLDIDGKSYTFDYVINSMGFPKNFNDYEVFENHPVNHCLVHNIEGDYSSIGHTGHTATIDGWMFEVPLKTRLSYGYLFNDKITNLEEAKKNFAQKINIPLDKLQNIEYKFIPYIRKQPLKGRVFNNGNQAYFFEPMFANSLMTYNHLDRKFFDFLVNGVSEEQTNGRCLHNIEAIRHTINYKYHGGSIYESEFWNNAKEITKNFDNCAFFRSLKDIISQNSKNGSETYETGVDFVYSWDSWLKLDRYLGYNIFEKCKYV